MKNQNDLIFSIVAIVILLIVVGVAWGTKTDPVQPTPPAAVNLAKPALPTGVVPVMADALPAKTAGNGQGGTFGGMNPGSTPGAGSFSGSNSAQQNPNAPGGANGPVTISPNTSH